MSNIKLVLGYDGTHYHGFQLQKNAITVQEQLEKAIKTVFSEDVRVTAAGRTDTGVHALGQVVNFTAAVRVPVERIPYALNAVLPPDIVVYNAEAVPDTFHARYSAVSKLYTYTIDNAAHPQVLARNYSYHVRFPLDIDRMQAAAATLLGKHDFSSFMASGSSVKTTVRTLIKLEVVQSGAFIIITAEADGFLYNMVRIISGTLIEVGRGKRDSDLSAVLQAKNRSSAGWTVPPYGLTLSEVRY